jgi:molecular chaperone GrpE
MLKSKKEKLEKELLENENIEIPITDESGKISEIDNSNSEKADRISELEKQADYYKDQLLRKAAEFENYKRRTDNEVSNLYRYANEGLILELLPVLDDFERIKKSWDEKHDIDSLKKGIDIVYDKFKKVLEKQGVKEIDALGKIFDVNLHEAIMQMPAGDIATDTVTNVIENGYWLKDKVLRHAKVIVSSKPEEEK